MGLRHLRGHAPKTVDPTRPISRVTGDLVQRPVLLVALLITQFIILACERVGQHLQTLDPDVGDPVCEYLELDRLRLTPAQHHGAAIR